MSGKKIIYATMVGDLFHRGHLEFIKKAKALGTFLIIGLHPDDVVKRYKREPIISFEDRKIIIESIEEVDLVVEDCMVFRKPTMFDNIRKHKVDVAVHAGNWLPDAYKEAERMKLCTIKEIDYYPHASTTDILQKITGKKRLTLVSAGDAITAKLIKEAGFDGIWVSGFEASARLGLADNGSITLTEMLNIAKPIVDVGLPVYVDCDTGYGNLKRTIKEFTDIGVAGICVEDNLEPKTNSLWHGKMPIMSKDEFCKKISIPHKINLIARTEALIRGFGMAIALSRSAEYYNAGADIVLIHTRDETGTEAKEIAFNKLHHIPHAIVPTKFPQFTNKQLFDMGYSMVIWANQTERTKIKATREMLATLKNHDRMLEAEKDLCATLDDMRGLTLCE